MWWSFVGFDLRISCVAGRSSFPPSFPQFPSTKSLEFCLFHAQFFKFIHESSAQTSGLTLGHPAPDNISSIHHPVSRLTLAKFYSGAHVHFRIPPSLPHSTTAFRKHHHHLPTTNSDNFDTFCFENLSCGSRVLLCFGYLGTVQHQHHRRSSSPRTRHQQRPLHHFDTILYARTITSSWYRNIIIHSCLCIDTQHSPILRILPIDASIGVLPSTSLAHISGHTSHSIHTIALVHILVSSLVSQSCHRIHNCYLAS